MDAAPTPPNHERRRRVVLAICGLLVIGGFTLVAVVRSGDDSDPPVAVAATAEAPAPTTTEAATTTSAPAPSTSTTVASTTIATTSTSTTTLPAQQTQPVAPPVDARGLEPLVQIGSIAIPAIGLDSAMFEGIRLTTLDHGPGHWPGSASPGQVGNVVVAGHRTSHGAQFRHLDRLVPGDTVTFSTAEGMFVYAVTSTEIVGPDALWIVDPSATPTATLFACHPPGSTRERIVVHLALVET